MANDYLPKSDGELTVWLETFKAKIAVHGAAIGLAEGDITTLQGKCDDLSAALNNVDTMCIPANVTRHSVEADQVV